MIIGGNSHMGRLGEATPRSQAVPRVSPTIIVWSLRHTVNCKVTLVLVRLEMLIRPVCTVQVHGSPRAPGQEGRSLLYLSEVDRLIGNFFLAFSSPVVSNGRGLEFMFLVAQTRKVYMKFTVHIYCNDLSSILIANGIY